MSAYFSMFVGTFQFKGLNIRKICQFSLLIGCVILHFITGSWAIEIQSRPSVLFSVQRDESTGVSNLPLLVVYIRNAVTLWKLSYSLWCATLRKLPPLQDTFLKKCYLCVYEGC